MLSKLGVLIIGLAVLTTGGYLTYERYLSPADYVAGSCGSHSASAISTECQGEEAASCCTATVSKAKACCSAEADEAVVSETIEIMPRILQ
jgi:hypothetical protein